MSSIERVEPVVVDGIEFYISKDGKQCGVSQAGLMRLIGCSKGLIYSMCQELSGESDPSKLTKYVLELSPSEVFYLPISSNQQAKVISSAYVSAIIEYYAFERNMPTAKFSFRKFSRIGIDTWIKDVVGYASNPDQSQLQASINQVIEMLGNTNERLKVLEQQTAGYRKVSIELPGLREWMSNVDTQEQLALEATDHEDLFTLSEYLKLEKGLVFDKRLMARFSNQVSYVYKTMSLEAPGKKQTQSANGYKSPPTNAYARRDFPMLDIAFKQVMVTT